MLRSFGGSEMCRRVWVVDVVDVVVVVVVGGGGVIVVVVVVIAVVVVVLGSRMGF